MGQQVFTLKHPSRPSITYRGQILSIVNTGERSPSGILLNHKVFKVTGVNAFMQSENEEQARLIHDSLCAYGQRHDGPNGTIEVVYARPNFSSYIVVLYDCGTPDQIAPIAQRHLKKLGTGDSAARIPAFTFLTEVAARGGHIGEEFGPQAWGFETNSLVADLAKKAGRNTNDHRVSGWGFKREHLDGDGFVQFLLPFFRDIATLDKNRPKLPPNEDRYGLHKVMAQPLAGEAAKLFSLMNFDRLLICCEDRRKGRISIWSDAKSWTGGLTMNKHVVPEGALFWISAEPDELGPPNFWRG